MSFRHCCARFLVAAIVVLLAMGSVVAAERPAAQYLLFQIFTGAPVPGTDDFRRIRSKADIVRIARNIAATVGPATKDSNRFLGFSIGPIAMDEGVVEARAVIRDAFEIALETGLAVAVHLDDYMFWSQARRPDGRLLRAIEGTAEWKDWSGTPAGRLEVGWLPNVNLAPQMCYESPAVREFAAYWTRDIIGQEVKQQFDKLVQAGKARLFAGVMVGWESNLAYGYCSLSQLGYSAQKLPRDFDRERERILQRHVERWAKGIYDAGIPRDRIFTHLGPIPKREYEKITTMLPPSRWREIHQSTGFRAFPAAFNEYSNPGFSGYPAEGLFEDFHRAIGAYGRGIWAMAEGVNAVLTPGGAARSPLSWETYLAKSFNHGASIVNLFGGFQGEGMGEFARSTESTQAVTAYRKFLRGDRLVERPAQ